MKNYKVQVISPANAVLQECEITEDLKPHEVLIRNHCTAVSAGTERAWSTDMHNAHPVFPYGPGYSGAGEVVKIGSEVENVKVGDRVVVNNGGHALYSIRPDGVVSAPEVMGRNPEALYAIKHTGIAHVPENVDMIDAAYAYIASFSLNGVRKLHLEMGENAMVIGLGVLGMFAMQCEVISGGLPVIVSDLSPARRAMALKLGADYALDPADKDYFDQIKQLTDGEGARAIIEVTGSAVALQQALEFAAWEARVVLLGCTRIPDVPIDFYRRVHGRGVQLLGAHNYSRALIESHPDHWTEQDDQKAYLKMVAAGKMSAKKFVSEVVTPDKAHDVFDTLAHDKNAPLGIVFDWRNL